GSVTDNVTDRTARISRVYEACNDVTANLPLRAPPLYFLVLTVLVLVPSLFSGNFYFYFPYFSSSAFQRVSLSACQPVSVSACQRVSVSACQRVSMSACQRVSVAPRHFQSPEKSKIF